MLTLENPTPQVAFFVRLAMKNSDGELADTAVWEDNYISLEPSEVRKVKVDVSRAGNMDETAVLDISGWNVDKKTEPVNLK